MSNNWQVKNQQAGNLDEYNAAKDWYVNLATNADRHRVRLLFLSGVHSDCSDILAFVKVVKEVKEGKTK